MEFFINKRRYCILMSFLLFVLFLKGRTQRPRTRRRRWRIRRWWTWVLIIIIIIIIIWRPLWRRRWIRFIFKRFNWVCCYIINFIFLLGIFFILISLFFFVFRGWWVCRYQFSVITETEIIAIKRIAAIIVKEEHKCRHSFIFIESLEIKAIKLFHLKYRLDNMWEW